MTDPVKSWLATSAPVAGHRGRLFFLGAHKVLLKTELPRLRHLGYEVFNPPYLSNVPDQSAITDWDFAQESTLPQWAFDKLRRFNFFYNPIDPDIADILNTYFDGAVVTILARWAVELARVFKGSIVFRTYGQTSSLSDDFDRVRGRTVIERHGSFHFLPHAAETLQSEQQWLVDKTVVVPYSLSDDIFEHAGSWKTSLERSRQIIVTAPNIRGNTFHRAHYSFLKEYFFQSHFKLMGVQLQPVGDPQVIGTVSREQQIESLRRASGYLYTYSDPRVCYLPPIEMMVLGGPVVYLRGSLLAAYVGPSGAGEAATIEQAHRLCTRLLSRDAALIDDLRASQASVWHRYSPAHVWPIFDREINRIFAGPSTKKPPDGSSGAEVTRHASSSGAERLSRFLLRLLEGGNDASSQEPGSMEKAFQAVLPVQESSSRQTVSTVEAERQIIRDASPSDQGLDATTKTTLKESSPDRMTQQDEGPFGTRILTNAMRRGGAVEMFRTVRAHGYSGDDVTLALFGTTGSTIDRQLISKHNLLLDGCILLRGRWESDEDSGLVRRRCGPGAPGFIAFGPYISLEPGSYRIVFEVTVHSPAPGEVGTVDFVSEGAVIASAPIAADDAATQRIVLHVAHGQARERCEFRVWTHGVTDLSVASIHLEH